MILIGLHKPSGPFTKVISWFTRSPYSHASINVNGNVYDARPFKGVRKTHAYPAKEHVDFLFVKGLTKDVELRVEKFLQAQTGKGYD